MGAKRRFTFGADRFSAVYLGILFIVVFGVWRPHLFLTSATFHSVASGQAISGITALAVLVPLIGGQFDLSVGANANLAGLVAVLLQNDSHVPAGIAVLAALAVGLLIGAVNGFLVVGFRVNSFIATLGMSSVLAALDDIVVGTSSPAPALSPAWNDLTQWTVGGLQVVVVYLLVLSLIVWWVIERTPAGRYLRAMGGNTDAARLSGVRVDRWTWISLIIGGGIAGFSGVLFSSLSGPSLTFGSTLLLPAFAAVFLGSTQLQPGRFNVWGTIIAIYVLATGVEGLQLVSGVDWLGDMFDGVALIVAVALAVTRQGGGRPSWLRIRKGRRASPSATTSEPLLPSPSG